MNYIFDSKVAEKVGVDSAVMLQNINFWIKKNKANNKHFYNGTYWTYNSIKAFEELFPFWSKRQIARILKNLVDNGYLITGHFNKVNYDRTKWYAITKKGYSILPNSEIEDTKPLNPKDQTVQPIPDINTYNKPDINTSNDPVEEIWSIYPNKKGKAESIKKIPKLLEEYGKEELIKCIKRYTKEVEGKDKQFILHGSTFFKGRFEDYLEKNYKPIQQEHKPTAEVKSVKIDKTKLGEL